LVKQKNQYFQGRVKLNNTLHHHFDLDIDMLQFVIDFKIIEMIVSNLFFRDDD